MSKSKRKADEVLAALRNGDKLDSIISRISSSTDEWHSISASAYYKSLQRAKRQRKLDEQKEHVGTASNEQVKEVLELNNEIAEYALLLPILSTTSDLDLIKRLSENLPQTEDLILNEIGILTMHPRFRVQQKKGRFEEFAPFKPFVKIIDAAYISYLRTNFTSCYMTLTPLIEGVILRWMGFQPGNEKPDFEDIRKFFSNSHRRQPNPFNIDFHYVYAKACDKILNRHLFKPSTSGPAHGDFNRHIASHLLNDNDFATKSNCIRLFMLLDTMSQIYLYETKISDPRFDVNDAYIKDEVELLITTMFNSAESSPECILLGSSNRDII